jgi:hypothetical protein
MSGNNSPQHQAATGGAEPTPAPDTTAGGAPGTEATALPPTSGETTAARTGAPETAAQAEAALTPPARPAAKAQLPTAEAAVGTDEGATPEAAPDAHTHADPDPGPEALAATATTEAAGGSGSDAGEGTAAAAPAFGRPSRGLLAGAAIAGALLIGVPFLVSGLLGKSSSDSKPSDQVADAGTVLNGSTTDSGAGAYGSASPDPTSPKATPSHPSGGKNTVKKGAGAAAAGAGSGAGVIAGSSAEAPKKASSGKSSTKKSTTPKVTATKTVISAPGTTIYGHASNKCIEMVGHKGADGSPLQINSCTGKNWQKWDFRSDGTIRSMGLCMDVAWGSSANGAVIQIAVCSGNPAQQFRLNSSNDLVNPQANKCVDVKDQGTANGTRLQLWDCNGQDNQKWSTR